jgi:streptogramin lyase
MSHYENGVLVRCFGVDQLKDPWGIAISPTNGRVYIADHGADCIRVYSQGGEYLTSWSDKGSMLSGMYGVTVDRNGNVIVLDYSNQCIHVFNSEGTHLYKYGIRGSGEGDSIYPTDVAADKNGFVYVCDANNSRIQKFDSNGKFVSCIVTKECGLSRPIGIVITDDQPLGHVIVTEWGATCVKVFAQ